MNCEEFRSETSAFLDGELAPGERAACEEHLDACAACRREAQALAAISGRLREWQEPGASEGFEAELAARIARATRPQRAAGGWSRVLAACAASFLLGCGMTYGLAGRSRPTAPVNAPSRPTEEPAVSRTPPCVEVIALAPSAWRLPEAIGRPQPRAGGPKEERVVLAPSMWSFRERIEQERKRRNEK